MILSTIPGLRTSTILKPRECTGFVRNGFESILIQLSMKQKLEHSELKTFSKLLKICYQNNFTFEIKVLLVANFQIVHGQSSILALNFYFWKFRRASQSLISSRQDLRERNKSQYGRFQFKGFRLPYIENMRERDSVWLVCLIRQPGRMKGKAARDETGDGLLF